MRLRVALAAIFLIAAVRVATTYRIFSQTHDERIHVAAGYQWLAHGAYTLDAEHPPLARIAFGLDSFVRGVELDRGLDRWQMGWALLHPRPGDYKRNLFGARLGNLPFLLLAMAIVYLWTRRLFGAPTAVLATALFSLLPPVLAHAGLATTDMAATATLAAALYAFARWLEEPSTRRAVVLGVAAGAGLAAKFSFVAYFPVGALVLWSAGVSPAGRAASRRPGDAGGTPARQPAWTPALLVAFLIVWAAYRGEIGTLRAAREVAFEAGTNAHRAAVYAKNPGYEWVREDHLERYGEFTKRAQRERGVEGIDFVDWAKAAGHPSPLARRSGDTMAGTPPIPRPRLAERIAEPFRAAWQRISLTVPLSAPTFLAGVQLMASHSARGHQSFLLGERSMDGWWYYFPVVLFFKTPLPFVILSLLGTVLLARSHAVALVPWALLLVAMTSSINIGVRHVLPLYPLFAIGAAYATVWLWRRGTRLRIAAGALLVWYLGATTLAHPDYLPYFNELAGRHPERIAIDSNLDWGQDLLRLRNVVRRERLAPLHLAVFTSSDWRSMGFDATPLAPGKCVTGWIAASETQLALEDHRWLQARPYRRVGKSIRLYHVPSCGLVADPTAQH